MKHVPLFVAAALALVLAGCGGSGSHDLLSGNPGTAASTIRVEAVTKLDPTVVQDPTNFQINEEYYFELVSYDSSGNRTVINNGVEWKSSDDKGTYGNLAGNSGYYSAGSKETPTEQAVEAIYNGQYYKTGYDIKPRQVRLTGKVASEADATKGVDGVIIDFYSLTPIDANDPNAPRSEVLSGTITTAYDGSFRASIPQDVVRYQIRSESVPDAFYRSYLAPMQDGTTNRFDAGQSDCHPPVPSSLPEVGLVQFPSPILLAPKSAGSTKPDPSGCYYQ